MYQSIEEAYGRDVVCSGQPAAALQKGIFPYRCIVLLPLLPPPSEGRQGKRSGAFCMTFCLSRFELDTAASH